MTFKLTPVPPPSLQVKQGLLSRLLQSRTQGFLLLQLPVGGLSSEEQKDFSLSFCSQAPVLSPRQLQSIGGYSLLLPSPQFMEQRLYLGHRATENTGVLTTTALACEGVAPPTRGSKLRGSQAACPTSHTCLH